MPKIQTVKSAFINLHSDGLTLTSQLAKDKEVNAVKQLIDFGAVIADAVYGAALAQDEDQVNTYLDECPESEMTAYTGNAIRGYARAGNFEAIYAIKEYKEYLYDLVVGWAQAGRADKLKPLIIKDMSLLPAAVEGYADCNHAELLINLLKGTNLYPKAIYYAARSKHPDLVTALLKECGVTDHQKVNLKATQSASTLKRQAQINTHSLFNDAVKGFTAGCHFKEAALLLERGASISLCLDELPVQNIEPFLVLLCYVSDKSISAALIEQIKLRFSVSGAAIPETTFEKAQNIKELMHQNKSNYIEAKNCFEDKDAALNNSIDITLSYLLNILSTELVLSLQSQQSPSM
jgi:hypothetical protein